MNPVPTVTGVTPTSAAAGSAALTITISGTGFIAASVIDWNSAALATNYISTTSLTAQIPASDLSSAGTAHISVNNPAPGGGMSGSLTFTINSVATNLTVLDLEGADLAGDPGQQKLYVAVPSTSSTNPNSITIVDPIVGSIGSSQALGSAPSRIVTSDNNQYVYAVIGGGTTIQRMILPALTPDIQWSLGTDPISGNPNIAGDIEVQPGAARTLAVSFGEFGDGFVAVFDDGVARSSVAGDGVDFLGNLLQWNSAGSELYATLNSSNYPLYTMPVTKNGVGAVTTYSGTFRSLGVHLHSDPSTGYVYDDWVRSPMQQPEFRLGIMHGLDPMVFILLDRCRWWIPAFSCSTHFLK